MADQVLYDSHEPMFRNHPVIFVASVLLIPVVVGIVILVVWYISSIARRFTITSEEMSYTTGILSKHRIELRLAQIRSVRVDQRFLQRIFRVGDIKIFTAGDAPELVVTGMPDPEKVSQIIRDRTTG